MSDAAMSCQGWCNMIAGIIVLGLIVTVGLSIFAGHIIEYGMGE